MKSDCTSYSSCLQRVRRATRLVSDSCCTRRRLTQLSWRSRYIILCTVSQWMPVSHEISRFNRCVFGLSSWLNTKSLTFSVFSLTHTERGLPLPSCRSIVSALRIFFNKVSITSTSTFWALVMSLSDRHLDWKNLCVNKILFIVVYSQNNMLLMVKFVIFCVLWFPKVR